MALDPLASVSDLADYGVDTTNTARAAKALAAASAAVRDAAGSAISSATSTVTLTGSTGQYLDLPVPVVTGVTLVEIDGEPVTDWRVVDHSLWRRNGWAACGGPATVEVTLTHGVNPVPDDIVLLVCELAGAILAGADEGGVSSRIGVQHEGIDDYTVTYETGSAASASMLDLPERTRQQLRRRFGGGAHVTGTR